MITKKLTASDVCRFAIERNKVNFTSTDDIGLFEVVCRGELERLISPDESVLDVVSRWTTWSLEERASNYLILKVDYVTNHVKNMAFGQTLYPTCEVLFAENRSFKRCFFKYVQGTIAQLKDAKSTKHLKEWNCDDLLWYFGCEIKRQPPKKFNLTFITKDDLIKRSKTNPCFGKTMCFKTEKDLYKWLCTVLLINVNIPF
uniref:Ras-associating domain-containing protein n=1 Tax=Romanomermis culicivorax TaxID=13658 RepID=A0A915I527_ROMCU